MRAVIKIGRRRSSALPVTLPAPDGYRFEIYVLEDDNPSDGPRTAWSSAFRSRVYPDEEEARREAVELIQICRDEFE